MHSTLANFGGSMPRPLTGTTTTTSTRFLKKFNPAICVRFRAGQRMGRQRAVLCRAENKEYYDYKDMPPLPLTVSKIYIPELNYTVVEKSNEPLRMASLAIFYDIYKDDQYKAQLTRKSAITALCMYDRDDVEEAQRTPGAFPNIDLLHRVYNEGLELDFCVQELEV